MQVALFCRQQLHSQLLPGQMNERGKEGDRVTSAAERQRWREGRCLSSERTGSLAAELALARRKQAPCGREIPISPEHKRVEGRRAVSTLRSSVRLWQ